MPVEVEILGQTLSVTSNDGEEHIRRVAAYVERTMKDVAAGGRVVSSLTVAVMAALNIASEYQKLKEEHADLKAAIDRLNARLVGRIAE